MRSNNNQNAHWLTHCQYYIIQKYESSIGWYLKGFFTNIATGKQLKLKSPNSSAEHQFLT